MGGNAVAPYVNTTRLELSAYKKLEAKTLDSCFKRFPEGRFSVVKYFTNKSDFGDVDLMYNVENNEKFLEELVPMLQETFNTSFELPVVRNGSVTSVGVPVDENEEKFFQLDFLYYSKENWEQAEFFLNYNDVGNLLGRVARFMGFKLSDKGLLYPFKNEHGHVVKDLVVTKDPDTVMTVMKLDKTLYAKGMDSMEDVYRFVMSSDYFVPDTFMAENQNNGLRKRERKRGAYKLFLEFLSELGEEKVSCRTYLFEDKPLARQTALEHTLNEVPSFRACYDEMFREAEKMQVFKKHFNGNLVTELTGLTGGELGKFMKFVQGEDKKGFVNFVVYNPKEKVVEHLLERFKEFSEN
jgi:hypothetical protein